VTINKNNGLKNVIKQENGINNNSKYSEDAIINPKSNN